VKKSSLTQPPGVIDRGTSFREEILNTLDFGAVMEQENWQEDIDLSCPFCDGENHRKYEELDEDEVFQVVFRYCKEQMLMPLGDFFTENAGRLGMTGEYEELDDDAKATVVQAFIDDFGVDEEDVKEYYAHNAYEFEFEPCEECYEGHVDLDVIWNTAYEVDVPYTCTAGCMAGGYYEDLRKKALQFGFLLIEHGQRYWLVMLSCGQDNTWRIHYTRYVIQGYLELEDIEACLGNYGAHVFLEGEEKRKLLAYFKERLPSPLQRVHRCALREKDFARIEDAEVDRALHNREVQEEDLPNRYFIVRSAVVLEGEYTVIARTRGEALHKLEAFIANPQNPDVTFNDEKIVGEVPVGAEEIGGMSKDE